MKFVYSCFVLLIISTSHAAIETYRFDDPERERRYQALAEELRCLVCQNQNIAASNADLAKDLRRQIYQMIKAGKSDRDITDFMVARYGDFVLYRPPLKGTTLILWIGPFILLSAAIVVLIRISRSRRPVTPLDETQKEQIRQLLDDQGNER